MTNSGAGLSIGRNQIFEYLVKPVYNALLRPLLPKKVAVYNTVAVRRPKLLDMTDEYPEYEAALLRQIGEHVSEGDRVIIVGGGLGVSSVCAARQGASVETYEASNERTEMIAETVRLNGVEDSVSCVHALVEAGVSVEGSPAAAERLEAADLPACETLVLDCEGAEVQILDGMEIDPATVIVEAHPMFGTPREAVEGALEDRGYEVVESADEETDRGAVTVMTATRPH